MAAPGRVTDEERDRIIATLRETENVRETARRHRRSVGTVSLIARSEGLCIAERSRTKNATRARVVDLKAMRLAAAERFLLDEQRLAEQMFAPVVEKKPMVVSNGGDAGSSVLEVETHLDEPTFADKQRIMTSRAIAIDKSMALERHDDTGDAEVADVDLWVDGMLGEDDDGEPLAA